MSSNPGALIDPNTPVMPTWRRRILDGTRDIKWTVELWRLWSFLSWNDIAQRYRRSLIGPFWLTLSMGIFIFSLGFVYAGLFKIPINEYLPYLAAGHVFFLLMNSIVLESCSAFMAGEQFIKQIPVPKFTFIIRNVLRNVIVFGHNFVVLALVWLWFSKPLYLVSLLSIIGLFFIVINGIFITTILAIICARFRDMPQIVINLMQVLFFITPVLWKTEQLSPRVRFIVELNPMAVFLKLARDPILGVIPNWHDWAYALAFTLAAGVFSFLFFSRYRSRISYWL